MHLGTPTLRDKGTLGERLPGMHGICLARWGGPHARDLKMSVEQNWNNQNYVAKEGHALAKTPAVPSAAGLPGVGSTDRQQRLSSSFSGNGSRTTPSGLITAPRWPIPASSVTESPDSSVGDRLCLVAGPYTPAVPLW